MLTEVRAGVSHRFTSLAPTLSSAGRPEYVQQSLSPARRRRSGGASGYWVATICSQDKPSGMRHGMERGDLDAFAQPAWSTASTTSYCYALPNDLLKVEVASSNNVSKRPG